MLPADLGTNHMRRFIAILFGIALTFSSIPYASTESYKGYAHVCTANNKLCDSETPLITVVCPVGMVCAGKTSTTTSTTTATGTGTFYQTPSQPVTCTVTASGGTLTGVNGISFIIGTSTSTATASATASGTSTATASATLPGTQTLTFNGTQSATGTGYVTNSWTTTSTYTGGRVVTATKTSSYTRTNTSATTGTQTATRTVTVVTTITTTATATVSGTSGATATATVTGTSSASGTASGTQTATATVSQTSTNSYTQSQTYTEGLVVVGTGTGTSSGGYSTTDTVTGTATATANVTFAGLATATATFTGSASGTATGTVTDTATGTSTTATLPTTITYTPPAAAPDPRGTLYLVSGAYVPLAGSASTAFIAEPSGETLSDPSRTLTAGGSIQSIFQGGQLCDPSYSGSGTPCSIVNRPELATSPKWIAPGTITIDLWAKSTSAVNVLVQLSLIPTFTAVDYRWISVPSSAWAMYETTISLPSGLLIPQNSQLVAFISAADPANGTPTVTIGATSGHYTTINGPWLAGDRTSLSRAVVVGGVPNTTSVTSGVSSAYTYDAVSGYTDIEATANLKNTGGSSTECTLYLYGDSSQLSINSYTLSAGADVTAVARFQGLFSGNSISVRVGAFTGGTCTVSAPGGDVGGRFIVRPTNPAVVPQ